VVVCVLRMQGNGWLVGWRSVAAATNLGGPANKQNEWMLMFGRKTTEETIDIQYDMRHYSSTMTSFTQASGYIHHFAFVSRQVPRTHLCTRDVWPTHSRSYH
jgi:hypothetical protein